MSELKSLGKTHHELMQLAHQLKEESNRNKIELGIVLLELQEFYKECEFEGIDAFGTYEQALAELHFNKRRVIQLLRNAKFVLEEKIPPATYSKWDSSILDLIRRNKKHPQDYRDSLEGGISYSDLIELLH